jgi:hypothetical protein
LRTRTSYAHAVQQSAVGFSSAISRSRIPNPLSSRYGPFFHFLDRALPLSRLQSFFRITYFIASISLFSSRYSRTLSTPLPLLAAGQLRRCCELFDFRGQMLFYLPAYVSLSSHQDHSSLARSRESVL